MTSVHKSFLVSLAAFLGVSIIFQVISDAIAGTLTDIGNDPFIIVVWLFQGIVYNLFRAISAFSTSIFGLIDGLGAGSDLAPLLATLVGSIGIILAPIIAAILAGVLAESKMDAFGGWLLTLVVCWLVFSIFYILGDLGIIADLGTAGTTYLGWAGSLHTSLVGISVSDAALWYLVIIMLCGTLITTVSWGMLPLAARKETFY